MRVRIPGNEYKGWILLLSDTFTMRFVGEVLFTYFPDGSLKEIRAYCHRIITQTRIS
jgi:hypothetical protein